MILTLTEKNKTAGTILNMGKRTHRSFTIDKGLSAELDSLAEKIKAKGIFWQEKNLGMVVSSASVLVEKFIISGVNHFKEILAKADG